MVLDLIQARQADSISRPPVRARSVTPYDPGQAPPSPLVRWFGGEARLEAVRALRSSGPGHRHPGPVLGYIAEGQMRFAINHEARPDGPTRALVFKVVPKGSPLTAPA